VHGQDRLDAVLGRVDDLEPAVGEERSPDPLGAFGDLVAGPAWPR
jgi:hypothetical protein